MVIKLDRHSRQNAHAEAVIARERARNEKRKNGLPPFLMVRSGLIKCWIPTMITVGGFALSALNAQNTQNINYERTTWPAGIWGVLLALASINNAIKADFRRNEMKHDIEIIQSEFYRYMRNNKYTLEFSEYVQNKKLMRILIEHIVKYDGGIFDKMTTNPKTVDDFDVRNDIIRGELKVHPDHAPKVIESFDEQDVSPKLYKKAQKYTERLRKSEKTK